MKNKINFLIISDIHAGTDFETLPGSKAFELLDIFIEKANSFFKPDFTVDLGDKINPHSENEDLKTLKIIIDKFLNLKNPSFFIQGNHDLENLDKESHSNLFHIHDNKKTQIDNFNLIFLNSQDEVIEGVGGSLYKTNLNWLDENIDDSKVNLIFTHQAIMEQNLNQNIHFKKMKTLGYIQQKDEILKIFKKHQSFKMIFNGHLHWTNINIKEDVFVSVPSFIDVWEKGRNPEGNITYVEIIDEKVSLSIYSLVPFIKVTSISF